MKKKLRKYLFAWLMIICMAGSILLAGQVSAGEAAAYSAGDGKAGTEPIKVACVGDSLTYGYLSSSQQTKSYPARLQELLGDGYIVQNFGRNSATLLNGTDMAYTDQAEYRNSIASNPDIVIIMLGTNDSKAKYWDVGGREQFADDAEALVSTYEELPSNPEVIFATSPTCLSASLNNIRGNIIENEIVPMQRQLAEKNGWKTIDMFALTSDKESLYHSDGIHFSDLGYYYEAECMYAAITGGAYLPEPLLVTDIRGLSEHPGNEAKNAVDNDYSTIWHSEWEPASDREDHVLILELAERSLAEGLDYLPRQTGTNGIITEYEIQTSNDCGSQYTTAAEGTWEADTSWKKVRFSEPTAATHIKLIVKEAAGSGGSFASAAEIRVEGSAYTAGALSEAKGNLQADYNSYHLRFTDESLYEESSWNVFQENMQLVQSRMGQNDLTLNEAITIGKDLRDAVLSLQKTELEALDINKAMERKIFVAEDDTILPYRIYLPEGYTAEKKYPLVLFLHGAGERGITNSAQLTNSNKDFFERLLGPERRDYPAIIVVPQCPANEQWVDTPWADGCYDLDSVEKSNEMQAVEELLDNLQETYRINKNRLYAVGFSMGAFGVWDLIMRNPDLMAAAIPISGAGDPSKAELIKDVPIWCFHGEDDPTVPCALSTPFMAAALEEAGSTKIRYTEYPAGTYPDGHLIASGVYEEKEFLSWLFGQKKKMDTADLSGIVSEAEKKNPQQYTEASYQTFLEALHAAQSILADDSAQQEEIDEALQKLQEAENSLEEITEDDSDTKTDTGSDTSTDTGSETNTDTGSDIKTKDSFDLESLKTPVILSSSRKSNRITVTWSPVLNAAGYEVSYCTTGAYKTIFVAGQGTASYQMKQANAKTVYKFRIRAYRDTDGKRSYSDYSAWNIHSVDIPKPKALSVKKLKNAVRIKWPKISGASGYKILRRIGKKGKFKTVGTVKKGSKVTFTDKKVKTGKKYYYKICALSKSGSYTCTGPLSAAKSVTF